MQQPSTISFNANSMYEFYTCECDKKEYYTQEEALCALTVELLKYISHLKDMHFAWLNIEDGTFSDSWDSREDTSTVLYEHFSGEHTIDNNYKLLQFKCLNDSNFVFTRQMRLR